MKLIRLSIYAETTSWVVEFYNEMSSAKGTKSSKMGGEQLDLPLLFALGANGSKPPIDPL